MTDQMPKQNRISVASVVTLVGVLVVLAFVLYPVMAPPSHGGARKSYCLTNMKELGLSFSMYMYYHAGTLPSSSIAGSSDDTYRKTYGQVPPPDTPGYQK